MKRIICFAMIFSLIFSMQLQAEDNAEYSADMAQHIKEEIVFTDEFVSLSFQKTRANQSITLNLVGMSSYIDFSNMESDFNPALVEYESSNPDVAVAWDGRILARGVGTAQITVKYYDLQQIIDVNVKKAVSRELQEALEYNIQAQNTSRTSTSQERLNIIYKAADMVSVEWIPAANLTGWRNEKTFVPTQVYYGVPYSQTEEQVDDVDFLSAMSNSDFYDVYTRFSIQMPKYGSDCSGFVSLAWGISRTVTAEFYANYPSIGDFSDLQTGDAIVSNAKRHIILVSSNYETPPSGSSYNEPYLVCYEQSPYDADLTFHTYSQLSGKGYKAISKFN